MERSASRENVFNARQMSHNLHTLLRWGSPSVTLFSLSFPLPHSSHILRYNMSRTNILQGAQNVVVSGSTLNATNTVCESHVVPASEADRRDLLQINYNYSNKTTSDAVIPLKPNSSTRFTGRTEVIAKLKDHFISTGDQRRIRKYFLLHGMGGIGKTQICLRFIEEMSDK